ncbi:MAG: hypothetical protein KKI02_00615 [Planctomycetes bacterium]|nr:hypothetical protein [Planctomycetota bacterium]
MGTPREGDVTRILGTAGAGDDQAAAELPRLVYSELRGLARARMAKTPEPRPNTILDVDSAASF